MQFSSARIMSERVFKGYGVVLRDCRLSDRLFRWMVSGWMMMMVDGSLALWNVMN